MRDVKALVQKLSRGRKDGVSLTREECDEAIATLVSLYEADGNPTEAAVAKVCKAYGVSRSQVFAARRRHPRTSEAYDSVWLDGLIGLYEDMWSK